MSSWFKKGRSYLLIHSKWQKCLQSITVSNVFLQCLSFRWSVPGNVEIVRVFVLLTRSHCYISTIFSWPCITASAFLRVKNYLLLSSMFLLKESVLLSYLSYFQLGTHWHCFICIMFNWQGVNAAVHLFLRSAVEFNYAGQGVSVAILRVWCSTDEKSLLLSYLLNIQLTRSHCCFPTCLIFSWRGVTVAVLPGRQGQDPKDVHLRQQLWQRHPGRHHTFLRLLGYSCSSLLGLHSEPWVDRIEIL